MAMIAAVATVPSSKNPLPRPPRRRQGSPQTGEPRVVRRDDGPAADSVVDGNDNAIDEDGTVPSDVAVTITGEAGGATTAAQGAKTWGDVSLYLRRKEEAAAVEEATEETK